jgi:hypothetical protein
MAIKLFKKNEEDVFAKLDKLMSNMASPEIYVQYLREREGM